MSYVSITDGLITGISQYPDDPLALNITDWETVYQPLGATVGWRYDDNRGVMNPADYPYDVWNGTSEEWEYSADLFTTILKDTLSDYRDEKIDSPAAVTLVFSGETLGLTCNARTIEAVGRKVRVAPLHDTDTFTVEYKFASYTPVNAADAGYRTVTTEFLMNFDVALDAFNQKHFSAEKHVLDIHMTTAFDDIQEAKDEFDDYLANN